MNRIAKFLLYACFSYLFSFMAALNTYAEMSATDPISETDKLTGLIIFSALFFLSLSAVFFTLLLKLIQSRNKLNENFHKLQTHHDDLLFQKHQWLETETELINTNHDLEKRITARTETVNKINHDLTKSLEQLHQQDQKINSLITALEHSRTKILIIDKHYRVCFASKNFLRFSGLALTDIKDQPLRRLEKHICLPEMASNGLTLNKEGMIDTQLKCLDHSGVTHWLNAQIALSWSDLKEILHYVIIFDDEEEAEPSMDHMP